MTYIFILFVGALIIFIYQYFYTGAFEFEQIWVVLLFFATFILVFFISKWQQNKDKNFESPIEDPLYTSRLGDQNTKGEKQIYFGHHHVGTYHRFYKNTWKRFVAGAARNSGSFYLNLQFRFFNGDKMTIQGKNETKLHGDSEFVVYKNDELLGNIRTDLSLKKGKRLKQKLVAEVKRKVYHLQSRSLDREMEIKLFGMTIAEGRRLNSLSSVYQLKVMEDDLLEDERNFLLAAYILFNYYFPQ